MEGKDPGRVRGRSAGRYEILVPTQLVQVQVNEETYIRGLTKTGVLGRCGSVAQRGIQNSTLPAQVRELVGLVNHCKSCNRGDPYHQVARSITLEVRVEIRSLRQ